MQMQSLVGKVFKVLKNVFGQRSSLRMHFRPVGAKNEMVSSDELASCPICMKGRYIFANLQTFGSRSRAASCAISEGQRFSSYHRLVRGLQWLLVDGALRTVSPEKAQKTRTFGRLQCLVDAASWLHMKSDHKRD